MLEIKKLDIQATHLLFLSDIHFGRHVNSEEWQENMRDYFYNFFIPYIKEIKSTLTENQKLVCINLGDTFQDRKAIDINVYNLAIDVCEDIAKEVEFIVLNGNHDLAKKTNEGNTSLRSLDYMPNITLLTDPTLISVKHGKSTTKFIAIPYLGNNELESEYLSTYSSKAKYALMHTELTKMKMDNGMLITVGANPELFKGKIFSGHIHRRQESKNAIYVGSPYHLDRGDIGDKKGLYYLNLENNDIIFKENNYSPIYRTLSMEDYAKMNINERRTYLNNNYVYVIIQEDDIATYKKKYDIYNLGVGTTAKFVKPCIIKKKQTIAAEEDNDYKEKTISELINESIDQLEIDDNAKTRLYQLSESYLADAENRLMQD